jgi:hypothetical protein
LTDFSLLQPNNDAPTTIHTVTNSYVSASPLLSSTRLMILILNVANSIFTITNFRPDPLLTQVTENISHSINTRQIWERDTLCRPPEYGELNMPSLWDLRFLWSHLLEETGTSVPLHYISPWPHICASHLGLMQSSESCLQNNRTRTATFFENILRVRLPSHAPQFSSAHPTATPGMLSRCALVNKFDYPRIVCSSELADTQYTTVAPLDARWPHLITHNCLSLPDFEMSPKILTVEQGASKPHTHTPRPCSHLPRLGIRHTRST